MEFCPKCGAILMMKKTKAGCPKCNYVAKGKVDMEIVEAIDAKVTVAVINEKEGEVNPMTDYDCKKCGHRDRIFGFSK